MNKKNFLFSLEMTIQKLPKSERDEILYDYEEHFKVGIEKGKTEEDIANSLGDPKIIGKNYIKDYYFDKAKEERSFGFFVRALMATIGLFFFNIFIGLWIYLTLFFILFGIWMVIFGAFLASLAGLFSPIIIRYIYIDAFFLQLHGGTSYAILFFLSIGSLALSILGAIGMFFVTKWFMIFTKKYILMNVNIILGKGGINE